MTEHLDDSTQQFAPLFGANNAVSGTVADSVDAAASDSIQGDEMRRRRIWPWVVIACLLVALGAACGGGVWFFQDHVLPGTTLWGNSVTGKTEQEIVDLINDQVDNTAVRAKYQGQSATFTLKDLGIEVDGEAIASDVINAQRGDAWWQQYAFWITHDVAPQINPELADGSVVDKALNIDAQEPVDAQVALNDNNSGFNVIAGENGQGANATSIAKQAISTVESLGSVQPQTVRVELDVTEPTITNAIADEAKTTLETLVNNAVAIKVADKDIATVNASMLGSAMRIDANQQSKLKDNEVDIIITDVMMPVMDGIKLCKNVKQNIRTCHIPVIILSAKTDIKDQLEGLQVGADDYIPKPFAIAVITSKIQNMMRTRRHMLERYAKSLEVEPEKITFNAMDEELLKRAVNIVEENIDNIEFSTDEFAQKMNMSRSNLHLKLKAITGESAIDFIRKVRFKRATELLKSGRYTVAEVSSMVGFNSSSYFATCFKKYVGCLPTEYIKKAKG